jgi:transcriptional regulator with XRE-family HTH domain
MKPDCPHVIEKFFKKTQEDFALLPGVSRNAVASLESGRSRLSARLANKISEQTGVNPLWLMANDPSVPMVNRDNSAAGSNVSSAPKFINLANFGMKSTAS